MSADLPKGWTLGRFRDALQISLRREAVNPQKTYRMLGVRWYGNGAFLREERLGESLSADHVYKVRSGDVIYNRLFAWKGAFGIVPKDLDGCHVSNEFPQFEAKTKDVFPGFILRVLQHHRTSERADAFSTGTTSISRNRLSEEDFLHFPILLPPVAEQKAIADVLDKIEATINETTLLIGAIVRAKRSVMRDLLTRGVRRDRAQLKSLSQRWILGRICNGINRIPLDWRLVTLSKVAKLESGHTPSRDQESYWNGKIPWLSLADTDALDDLTVAEANEYVTDDGIDNSSARVLPKNTVIFSRTATVGKATRLSIPMATSQDFANWICSPELDPRYLVQVFRHMDREWLRLQEGSTHQTIYMPVFKKLQILLPPVAEQKNIADMGDAFDMRIWNERAELNRLREIRSALAQELISGRTRLPNSAIARHRDQPGKAA